MFVRKGKFEALVAGLEVGPGKSVGQLDAVVPFRRPLLVRCGAGPEIGIGDLAVGADRARKDKCVSAIEGGQVEVIAAYMPGKKAMIAVRVEKRAEQARAALCELADRCRIAAVGFMEADGPAAGQIVIGGGAGFCRRPAAGHGLEWHDLGFAEALDQGEVAGQLAIDQVGPNLVVEGGEPQHELAVGEPDVVDAHTFLAVDQAGAVIAVVLGDLDAGLDVAAGEGDAGVPVAGGHGHGCRRRLVDRLLAARHEE